MTYRALVFGFVGIIWTAILVSCGPDFNNQLETLKEDFRYVLDPPDRIISGDESQSQVIIPTSEIDGMTRTPTATISLTRTTPVPNTGTPFPTATITPSPTLLPDQTVLEGFTHAFQMLNNDGPANLAMGLSYWGWEGDQRVTGDALKPNERDKNVMPYELQDFVEGVTELESIVRVGGDIEMLKALISSGYPVIVERGYEGSEFDGWMGHYQVVSGYDDGKQVFYTQDSLKGPGYSIGYDEFLGYWRAFNYTYIVLYPPERDTIVKDILDDQENAHSNFLHASEIAAADVEGLRGRDLFFAFYNLGTNLVNLNDYGNAAVAYDAAFANFQELPDDIKPWRILWYQTGPYFAYYYTGRYEDMIALADTTLGTINETILEESYYWRAKAKLALGDREGAIEDFQKSLLAHPDFAPSVTELLRLGIEL